MKSLTIKLFALLAIPILSGEVLGAGAARGLVLYDQPPATYVVPLEFAAIKTTSVAFVTVTLPDGKQQEIPRAGVVAVIDYPPDTPSASFPTEAAAATHNIRALSAKYPQCATKLNSALEKWTNALAFFQQKQKSASADRSTPPARGAALQIAGVKYTDVTLTSFDGAFVGIQHSAGFARLAAITLKPDQIEALNATSSSVHIDASKIVAATPAPKTVAESPAAGNKIGDPSTVNGKARPMAVAAPESKTPAAEMLRRMAEDEFVEPDHIAAIEGPSYAETVAFISGKIGSFQKLGFGKQTQMMIFRQDFRSNGTINTRVTTFDPKDLDPEVRYDNGGHVTLRGHTTRTKFTMYYLTGKPDKIGVQKDAEFIFYAGDRLDAQKVAKAFSHLILLFGGKPDAF